MRVKAVSVPRSPAELLERRRRPSAEHAERHVSGTRRLDRLSNHGYNLSVSGDWVLLSYRLPREPSAPRVALWRRLKRLGVARVSDGLVALPADARTREQLEWAAEEIVEHGGSSSVWLAQPSTSAHERELASAMAAERAAEWTEIADAARLALNAAPAEQRSALTRLRSASRSVARRDFFPPPQRDTAGQAMRELEQRADATDHPQVSRPR